jgi:hypothetical protein
MNETNTKHKPTCPKACGCVRCQSFYCTCKPCEPPSIKTFTVRDARGKEKKIERVRGIQI